MKIILFGNHITDGIVSIIICYSCLHFCVARQDAFTQGSNVAMETVYVSHHISAWNTLYM